MHKYRRLLIKNHKQETHSLHTHVHMHTNTVTYAYARTHTHIHLHTHTHAYSRIYAHTHAHTCTCTHIYTHKQANTNIAAFTSVSVYSAISCAQCGPTTFYFVIVLGLSPLVDKKRKKQQYYVETYVFRQLAVFESRALTPNPRYSACLACINTKYVIVTCQVCDPDLLSNTVTQPDIGV